MKQKAIQVKNLSKDYRRGLEITQALQGISLSIDEGDVYGIIGLSGAGKSTLIRCLASLVKPSSGQTLFQGVDIAQLEGKNLRSFRKKIGMIFQNFNLLGSRTVAENVAYPLEIGGIAKEEQKRLVTTYLQLVGLEEKKDAYPSQLSGGQKQRVAIARALVHRPEVLFCDEATSALDPKTTKEILDLLRKIKQELPITIVLITHDMEVVKRICTKVAVIEAGRIVEEGCVVELFADPKHPMTKHLIQKSTHDLPPEFFASPSPNRKLLRLTFKGTAASEPLISQIVKQFQVEANILLGWIDHLEAMTIGTLVIELTGAPESLASALAFLTQKGVHFEVYGN